MSYAAAVANMKAALVHAGKIGKMHVTITCGKMADIGAIMP